MKAGRLRPLALLDHERMPGAAWKDVPTMKEATGKDIAYLMLRGIFMAPGVKQEEIDFYVNVMKKVSGDPGMEQVHG